LKDYIKEFNYASHQMEEPLFKNQWGQRISRFGVDYILKKYYEVAKHTGTGFPNIISPHALRHSRAMALKAHDVGLMDIRDVLGHSSTEVTEIYARIDGKTRNEAIEKCSSILVTLETPCWEKDKNLKEFLKSLSS
jgi:integrase/recombinase XerD